MKCLKCQNDAFDKSTILARTLDIESKNNPNNDKFEILTCKKCHLTQWYDSDILTGKEKPERTYEKSVYGLPELSEFICFDCHSHTYTININAPVIDVLCWEGEILSRTCTKCGLTEFYQSMLVTTDSRYSGRVIWLKQKAELAKSFNCIICASQKVKEIGQIEFANFISQPAYFSQQSAEFIFITCDKCKYMMLFAGYVD